MQLLIGAPSSIVESWKLSCKYLCFDFEGTLGEAFLHARGLVPSEELSSTFLFYWQAGEELSGDFSLTDAEGYCLLHEGGEYHVRLLRLDVPWKFVKDTPVGLTVPLLENAIVKTTRAYTSVTRDLLQEGDRYYSKRNFLRALRYLQERESYQGWDQELYYLFLRCFKCHQHLQQSEEAMGYLQKAREILPLRSEAYYLLGRYLRVEKGRPREAYREIERVAECPETSDVFHVRPTTAEGGVKLLYEKAMLEYNLAKSTAVGLRSCVDFINASSGKTDPKLVENVFNGLPFYYEPLKVEWKRLNFEGLLPKFRSSSISIDADKRAVIRTVDYYINKVGGYEFADGWSVNTVNYLSTWDNEKREFGPLSRLPDPELPKNTNARIRGMEDVRLNEGMITATTQEFSYAGQSNRMIVGRIDDIRTWVVAKPPTETGCEKNWIPLGKGRYIYSWAPYRIGVMMGNQLVINYCQSLPRFCQQFRGSSSPFEYQGVYYALVHYVHHGNPRKYIHCWARLDQQYQVTGYSLPFIFQGTSPIEYSLGAQCFDGENVEIFMSVMDRESWHGRISARSITEAIIPLYLC